MHFISLSRSLRLLAVALFSVSLLGCFVVEEGDGPDEVVDPLFAGGPPPVLVPPPAMPVVAAPTPPARNAADVVSLFSNAYTDVTVDTWAAGFSNTTFADIQVAGNDTKEYTAFGFAGVEFLGANSIDITGMTHFHFDIWTPDNTDFLFKVVNFNGAGGFESESSTTINAGSTPALTQGTWVSVDIPITQLQADGLGATPNDVSQLIFDGIPDGGAVYIDNVYFYDNAGGPPTAPTVAAPTPPARNAADVISLFSNAYTDVTVDTWAAGFSNTMFADIQVAGNDTKEYTVFGFAGVEFLGANSIDITGMTHFHFDIWTPDNTDFLFKVVNFNGAGGFESESSTTINAGSTPALTQGTWVSVDIPITQLQADGLGVTPDDVSQLILDGIPDGGSVYIDNVYFYTTGPVTVPPVAAPTPPARAPADVISLFSNAYTDVTVDTWAAGFSNTSFSDVQIAGNDTKEYTAFGFAGVEFLGANSIDITGMTRFHFDIWTPDNTDFLFKVVNFNGAGGFESESSTTINAGSTPALTQGTWVSVDIPITQLQADGLGVTPNDVSQLILDGIPDGGAVYIDNVYFYKPASGPTNIAENGGFESGDFTGWTQFESQVGNQTINTSMVGDTSSEGTRHLEIRNTAAGTNSLVKQERKGLGVVTPGIPWTVTFDARGSFNAGGVAFAQVFCETAGGSEACNSGGGILGGAPLAVNADPTVWTSFTFSGTAGPTTESLTLQLEAVTGGAPADTNMFYDNIVINVGP